MKILEIMPDFNLAGAEIMVENLCYELNKQHEIMVVSMYHCETAITERLIHNGINLVFLDKKSGFDWSATQKLKKIIRDFRPDIIHTHRYMLMYAVLAGGLSKERKIFHTVHNVAEKEVPSKLQHFQKFLFRSRKAVPVAISPRVRKSIEKRYGMNINEIPMIYNGIDVNNFSPKDDYAQHDVFTCLHIGRFSEQKNHIEMVLALKKLIDAGEKIRFIFVGEGDLLGDIKEQVDKQHLTKYVIFAGTTGNVRPWFEKSDLFMLPSKWEGMPMTLIEAMSAAMPIIASNVGGVPDMLENERSALLIEPNADEIVEVISKLKENESLRRSLGQEAYRDSTKFKAVHMGKEYSNVFNNYPLMR